MTYDFRIPFSGVGVRYTSEEKESVLAAMESTGTLTQGPLLKRFEAKFCDFANVRYAFGTSSAAGALELAAKLLCKPGDEVICPAHTYCASAYPFAKHGAKLIWADINPDTWVVDLNCIKKVATDKTRVLIVVHLYGLPANMQEIMAFARDRNIWVIEDCAQAIGASVNGKKVGGFGDLSVFSFHSHKNISTLGEGGMLCTNNSRFSALIPGLRHNGHRQFVRPQTDDYWIPAMVDVEQDLDNVWPSNFCLGEVQSALGAAMLPRIDEINRFRKSRFLRFCSRIKSFVQIQPQVIPPELESSYHLLPFRFRGNTLTRDCLIRKLAKDYSIQAVVQYYPLNRYGLFYKNGFGEAEIPETDEFFDNMVSLPFHHWLSEEDFEYMVDSLIDCLTTYDQ